MWSYFDEKQVFYNLRDDSKLFLPKTKVFTFNINSLLFRGSLLWSNLPISVKKSGKYSL